MAICTPLSGSFRQLFQQLFRQDRSRQAGLRCSSAVPAPFRQGPGTSPERRWNAARKGAGLGLEQGMRTDLTAVAWPQRGRAGISPLLGEPRLAAGLGGQPADLHPPVPRGSQLQ